MLVPGRLADCVAGLGGMMMALGSLEFLLFLLLLPHAPRRGLACDGTCKIDV
jgi:hypothetical protein